MFIEKEYKKKKKAHLNNRLFITLRQLERHLGCYSWDTQFRPFCISATESFGKSVMTKHSSTIKQKSPIVINQFVSAFF